MESIIATREEIEQFLFIQQPIFYYNYNLSNGYSDGCGYGCGSVDSCGSGYGYGCGYGLSSGYGTDYGDGYGYGNSYGSGYGYGDGYSDDYGERSNSIRDFSYGCIYNKYIKEFNGNIVDHIDNIPTIIIQVRGNIAYGYIVKDDLTLFPCYVVKVGNFFAHGETIKDAVADAEAKEMENMPIEERIKKFVEVFGSLNSEYTGKEFYDWHHILTGSCRMGRDEFCKAHNIDLKKEYTVKYFLEITKESYGSDVIKQVCEFYK